MPKLVYWSEKVGCGATVELDSGETCMISVAQAGVLVRSYKKGFVGALVGSFLGPKLYEEKNVYKAASTAMALDTLFPQYLVPLRLNSPVLAAFTNAVWQCSTAAKVSVVLNSAVDKAAGGGTATAEGAAASRSGDGRSPEMPIVVDAKNSIEGIAKEYSSLGARFGKKDVDWKVADRLLVESGDGRMLEKFILSVRGRRVEVYFDISAFVHSNGPEVQAALDGAIARRDRNLEVLFPKDRAMFLMEFILKLTADQLEQIGWAVELKNALVGCLADALKPFLGVDYEDIPPSYAVAMMLSQWSKVHAFLRLCEPQDIEQEEELEDIKAIIGGAMEEGKGQN